jgi:hypothetical protein
MYICECDHQIDNQRFGHQIKGVGLFFCDQTKGVGRSTKAGLFGLRSVSYHLLIRQLPRLGVIYNV